MPKAKHLNRAYKKAIRSSDHGMIERKFLEVTTNARTSRRWIAKTSRYAKDTVNRIKQDSQARPPTINDNLLSKYIAISVPLHTMDSWSFLRRAIDSLLRGDALAAIHMSYYCELRASMAILASSGIGIFDKWHFAVQGDGSCKVVCRAGTHDAAWYVLDYWAGTKQAVTSLANTLKPAGNSIEDWILAAGLSHSLQPLAKKWFSEWGLDIGSFFDDRDARNFSSYRPNHHWTTHALDCDDVFKLINEVIAIIEPMPGQNFSKLDFHLVRIAFEISFKSMYDRAPHPTDPDFIRHVDAAVGSLTLIGITPAHAKDFFLRIREPDNLKIISYSMESQDLSSPDFVFQILSRSFLMLRLATGGAQRLSTSAAITSGDFEFWLDPIAKQRGFWNTPVADYNDLWSELSEASDEVNAWIAEGNVLTTLNTRQELSREFYVLSEFDRAIFWNLFS